jgi:hypothetical protein
MLDSKQKSPWKQNTIHSRNPKRRTSSKQPMYPRSPPLLPLPKLPSHSKITYIMEASRLRLRTEHTSIVVQDVSMPPRNDINDSSTARFRLAWKHGPACAQSQKLLTGRYLALICPTCDLSCNARLCAAISLCSIWRGVWLHGLLQTRMGDEVHIARVLCVWV